MIFQLSLERNAAPLLPWAQAGLSAAGWLRPTERLRDLLAMESHGIEKTCLA